MALRYWVGGSGNWSSTTKWSTTSGGASGASVPTITDDVIFDTNSGLNNGTVTVDTIGGSFCNNLTITAPVSVGWTVININDSLTINGNFSTTSTINANRRTLIKSSTKNFRAYLYVNSFSNLFDLDFKDLTVRTATGVNLSGTRIGNHQNVTGVTFSEPKTVYYTKTTGGNWTEDYVWSSSPTGYPGYNQFFPLAQDTVLFVNAGIGTATLTIDTYTLYIPTIDSTARTTALNINVSQSNLSVFGNIRNGNVNFSGSSTFTFENEVGQHLLSNGKSFSTITFVINSLSGIFELQDAASLYIFTVTAGTFKTNNYNLTCSSQINFDSQFKRQVILGSSTVTSGPTSNFIIANNTDSVKSLTLDAGTSTIICQYFLFTNEKFNFYNVRFQSASQSVSYLISGILNCVNLILGQPAAVVETVSLNISSPVNISGTLQSLSTSEGKRVHIIGTTDTGTTITVNTLNVQYCDFSNTIISGAASGTTLSNCGDCGGNSGLIFPSPKTLYLISGTGISSAVWSLTSGGSGASIFPLAQDTIVVDNLTTSTNFTTTYGFNFGTLDFSNRTTGFQFRQGNNNCKVFGDIKFSSAITTLNTNTLGLSGNKNQILDLNGVSLTFGIGISKSSKTRVDLQSALNSSQSIILSSGDFYANNYNVTCFSFSVSASSASTFVSLYMGSGLWTLTGTGTVWDTNGNINFKFSKQTADILLSDTSTTARTFSGGARPFNKLTIGGTTGTSTLTISNGTSNFRELASIKTVAHTIAFNSTTIIQKWSVSGSAGNLVTLTSLNLVIINGSSPSVDYLALGTSATISTTSKTEFYAGSNSTGTVVAPLYLGTQPASRTLYWVGGTGNWTDTTKWSLSSGGTGGQAIPRSNDNVIFDNLSSTSAYTVTVNAISYCNNFTVSGPASGNMTLAGTSRLNIHGNISLPLTGFARTYTAQIALSGTGSKTITSNGKQLTTGGFVLSGYQADWTLLDAFTGGLTFESGKLITSNYSISGSLTAQNNTDSTILLGSSTITGNLTLNEPPTTTTSTAFWGLDTVLDSGTSTISLIGNFTNLQMRERTLYNVIFNQPGADCRISGYDNTFNSITVSNKTQAFAQIKIYGDQTITGNLDLGSSTNALARVFICSNNIGIPRKLTTNTISSSSDCDFRDIWLVGPNVPISGTRFGDCKGNTGINFDAPKTVYWVATTGTDWLSNSWSSVQNGTANSIYFPLPQDTAKFTTRPTTSPTISISNLYNIGTIDMSGMASALTISVTATLPGSGDMPTVYGNWINNNNVTLSGTSTIKFSGRNTQTITSSGKSFTQAITIQSPGGVVSLGDAFSTVHATTAFNIGSGTFSANSYNVTCTSLTVGASAIINMGSGSWTISGNISGTPVNISGTINKDTSNLIFTDSTAADKNIYFTNGNSFNKITLAGTVNCRYIFQTRDFTVSELASIKTTGYTILFNSFVQPKIEKFSISGSLGNLVNITGSVSTSSPSYIDYIGTEEVVLSYCVINGLGVYPKNKFYFDNQNTNTIYESFNMTYKIPITVNYSNFFVFF